MACGCDKDFALVAVKRPWIPEIVFAMFKWVVPYQPFRWVFTTKLDEEAMKGRQMSERTIDIVFDGPPGPVAGRFVEVERDGQSIRLGEWVERPDGFWALRIPDPDGEPECADIFCLPPMHAKDCPLSAAPPAEKGEM